MNPTVITDPEKYKKGWVGGLPETPCGYGSKLSQTRQQREWIPGLINMYGIRTIADIGAGDLNWIRQMEFPEGVEYTAYDLIPRHESVKPFNLLEDECPQVDMLMCLWVLNHFPEPMMKVGFDRLMNSGSKWLLMTWDCRLPEFLNVPYSEQILLRGAQHHTNPHNGLFMRLVRC